LWISACGLLLLIALGFGAKPAYTAFREHRTNGTLAAAQAAERAEDWTTARDKARSVLLVRQDDFEAFRIWARTRVKLGEPSAYMAAAALVMDPRATRESSLEMFRLLVLQAPQALVLGVYYNLPKDLAGQPAFCAAMIRLLTERGEFDLAEKGLRGDALPGAGPDVKLELLRVLCCRPDAQRVAEARRVFAELVTAKANDEALDALLLLGAVPGGLAPGEPLPDLPAWLKQQPAATAKHHLLALESGLTVNPAAAQSCYQTACDRFLKTDPAALGAWLTRHGQAEMTVRILAEAAQSNSDAYLCRLSALLGLEQKAELETALASPPAAVDSVAFEIMQARFAGLRGDLIAADTAWTRALDRAAFDTSRNRFIDIARAAAAAHAKDAEVNAWVAAIRLGWGPLPLFRDLMPIYNSLLTKGRSEDLLAMFRVLERFEPSNADLVSNLCYLGLLHGLMTPGQVIATMTKLVNSEGLAGYHCTLMLAEMMNDQAAAALKRVQEFRYDPGVSKELKIALEGSAWVLAGETTKGSELLKKLNWRALMPQEKIVFRGLLVKQKTEGLPIPELDIPKDIAAPEQTPAWRKAIESLEHSQKAEPETDPGQTPAWRRAVEQPADSGKPMPGADPSQTPAWRKAVEGLGKGGGDEVLPPLPAPKVH